MRFFLRAQFVTCAPLLCFFVVALGFMVGILNYHSLYTTFSAVSQSLNHVLSSVRACPLCAFCPPPSSSCCFRLHREIHATLLPFLLFPVMFFFISLYGSVLAFFCYIVDRLDFVSLIKGARALPWQAAGLLASQSDASETWI